LLRRLSDAGISESRVDLRWQFGDHHLNFYSDIDILLDVFPWGSGTTAWECTWQGVPIPTIQDPVSSSAATASLLMNSGFPELIAANEQEYIGIVERLSLHPAELSRLRFAMRPAMAKTVCDAQLYARQFEGSLRQMWMLYCEQYEAPATSEVDAESLKNSNSQINRHASDGRTLQSQLGDRWS
jgi:predicted O-linked N-acetylglucosamine transferase (SPINDLY family)